MILLSVHLLAMNVASAGPLVCVCLRGRRSAPTETANQVGRQLAWLSVAALVVGMLLGGAIVYVPSNAALWEALRRFPARTYWHASSELAFSLACMTVYAGAWRRLERRRWLHVVLALVATTDLLYHFPPLMAVIGKLASNPSWTITQVIDRPVLRGLIIRGDVASLWIHFVLASLAVAGVTALVLVSRRGESVWADQSAQRAARVAAGIALGATILQLPVGVWVLSAMSQVARGALMGESPWASLLFLAALLLVLLLAGRLLAIAWGDAPRVDARRAGWLLVGVVVLMTASMRASRSGPSAIADPTGDTKVVFHGVADASSSSFSGSFIASSSGPPGNLFSLMRSP